MTLLLIGINHKTAPIEVRERVAISHEELPGATRALAAVPGVSEAAQSQKPAVDQPPFF